MRRARGRLPPPSLRSNSSSSFLLERCRPRGPETLYLILVDHETYIQRGRRRPRGHTKRGRDALSRSGPFSRGLPRLGRLLLRQLCELPALEYLVDEPVFEGFGRGQDLVSFDVLGHLLHGGARVLGDRLLVIGRAHV